MISYILINDKYFNTEGLKKYLETMKLNVKKLG